MLRASLFQSRPDEAEIQRRYIERKQYDFAVDRPGRDQTRKGKSHLVKHGVGDQNHYEGRY